MGHQETYAERLNYKRCVQLLGQLEDLIGCTSEFEMHERRVGQAIDAGTGATWGFIIEDLNKAIDKARAQ